MRATGMALAGVLTVLGCGGSEPTPEPATETPTEEELMARAERVTHEAILVDTHIDVPYRFEAGEEDISRRTERGDFDHPRAVAGGLDAAFMSIYVPADLQGEGGTSDGRVRPGQRADRPGRGVDRALAGSIRARHESGRGAGDRRERRRGRAAAGHRERSADPDARRPGALP